MAIIVYTCMLKKLLLYEHTVWKPLHSIQERHTKCDGSFLDVVVFLLSHKLQDCPVLLYCSILSTIPFMIETFSFYSTHYPKLKTVESLETIITRCPHGVNTGELNCFAQPNERATGSLGGLCTYRLGTL